MESCPAQTKVEKPDPDFTYRDNWKFLTEQWEKIQYSRRNDYKEKAQAYFEHLIPEVNGPSDCKWTFKPQRKKDAQDLADESLAAEPEVEE
ncbi:hypothetical protein BGZ47_004660, partial [Haplosporangium gracile]